MLSAEEILNIPITDPGKLFPRDRTELELIYHHLAHKWHPDKPGGSTEVFAHIAILHKAAKEGKWDNSQILNITAKTGKEYVVKYKIKHPFELGDVFIGQSYVIWFVKKEYEDFVLNGIKTLSGIKFPDEKMRKQHEQFVPRA